MRKFFARLLLAAPLLCGAISLTGCDAGDGPAEKAGEKVDNAADNAADAVDDATN